MDARSKSLLRPFGDIRALAGKVGLSHPTYVLEAFAKVGFPVALQRSSHLGLPWRMLKPNGNNETCPTTPKIQLNSLIG